MDIFAFGIKIVENFIICATIIFIISISTSGFLMPKINNLGLRMNVIDIPNTRKQHTKKIVRLGGLGIYFGFLTGIFFLLVIRIFFSKDIFELNQLIPIILGSGFLFLLGISDDFKQKNPYLKLILQISIASLMYSNNVKLEAAAVPFFNLDISFLNFQELFIYLFTVFWIVGITNSINWLDGLDGLAAGISAIISLGLSINFFHFQQFDLAFILIAFLGSTIGFLRFNFYPAKILMGDGGSYFLGGFLSIISLKGINLISQLDNAQNESLALPFLVMFLLFCLPLTDLFIVTTSRVFQGYSPFYPDRRHLHHKMLNLGLSHRDTVILFYGFTQLFVSISLYINGVEGKLIFLCLSLILITLCILYCINFKPKLKKK
tara:strand:- start:1963 stop:3093 length:1131 start_codon:yes stop_codon:yes gene_type:complete